MDAHPENIRGQTLTVRSIEIVLVAWTTASTMVPYNPEQNGLAYQRNRTLVECAKSMLFYVGLEKLFWANAVVTESYVVNRLLTKGLPVTPEKKFASKLPELSHLRILEVKLWCMSPSNSDGNGLRSQNEQFSWATVRTRSHIECTTIKLKSAVTHISG